MFYPGRGKQIKLLWQGSLAATSANSDPATVRIIEDNPIYAPYERSAEEVNVVGRIWWLAREI